MGLRVVGAGLARTGTTSLRHALQTLLGGACYHMSEVFPRPDHVTAWHQASLGKFPDWDELFAGFDATGCGSGFRLQKSAGSDDDERGIEVAGDGGGDVIENVGIDG